MDEALNSKLAHLPWLWQWKEANEQAKRIIKSGLSTNDEVQMLVDEYRLLKRFTVSEIEDKITDLILQKQGISLSETGRYSQNELF